MQLIKPFTYTLCVLVAIGSFAQDTTATVGRDSSKIKLDDIKVNFLSSYYVQDGNHSPVTGGVGTEFLTNIAPSTSWYIPLDTAKTLLIDAGVDYYTSASSDNIDNPELRPDHISGASGLDSRLYLTATIKKKIDPQTEWGVTLGASTEYDVTSVNGGISFGRTSKDKNRGIDIKTTYYLDSWSLIYPSELRNGTVALDQDQRSTLNTSATVFANLSKRLSASFTADLVLQRGLLSTPFHRVYFADQNLTSLEILPNTRTKYPLGLRLNYHATDFLILKSFYRYYVDSWGVSAQTLELTVPLKISQAFRVYPFYRLLIQQQADYFAPFQEHVSTDQFFTSDHDLSTFDATKYGIGFSYTPLFGIGRVKVRKKISVLKSFSLRYAKYSRTDGLNADVITMGLEFAIKSTR